MPLKRDISAFAFSYARWPAVASCVWRSRGSISPGWSRGQTAPYTRYTALRFVEGTAPQAGRRPAAKRQRETTCIGRSRKCSGRRRTDCRCPAQDSFRRHNCSTHVPIAAPRGAVGRSYGECDLLQSFHKLMPLFSKYFSCNILQFSCVWHILLLSAEGR